MNYTSKILQCVLSQRWFSRFMGLIANCRLWPVNYLAIKTFLAVYKVDLNEAEYSDIRSYENFQNFFIRKLKPESRPIADGTKTIVSAVDGLVIQAGKIMDKQMFQAKGFAFSTKELLGGTKEDQAFKEGSFVCTYLAPNDYHRVHMPFSGTLSKMIYIPGCLFPVAPRMMSLVPNIFARNERIACFFETEFGPMSVVLVGAANVGSIYTAWAGKVVPSENRKVTIWEYNDDEIYPISLTKGEELGFFCAGSTVFTLFSKEAMSFSREITAGTHVRYGELVGSFE